MYRTLPALILLLLPAAASTAQECESRQSESAASPAGVTQRFAPRAAAMQARRGAEAQRDRGERGHRPPALVAALDRDSDGILSAEEIANAAAALLTLDADGDGQLTRAELAPGMEKGRKERGEHKRRDRGDEGAAR